MKLKKILPITSGTRHKISLQNNLLVKKNKVIKTLLKNINSRNGRGNNTGRITVRHKGGGCKKKIHILNSLQKYFAINICHMYSGRQNSFISLNFDFITKSFFKTISTETVYPGSLLISNTEVKEPFIGYRMELKFIPVGTIIHNISYKNNTLYASSAGTFCQLLEKKKTCKIRLPSGKIILISNNFYATIGSGSNIQHKSICIGKAGKNRLKGIRPSTRGVAMNPVDHPHGGRTNGGRPSVSPWGILTKGKPTVKKLKL